MIDTLYSPQDHLNCDVERLIAVGDIHGQYELLKKLVETEIKFDVKKDSIVFLGDYIDKAESSEDEVNTINFLIDLANNNPGRVLLLKGNHEDMAYHAIVNGSEDMKQCWIRNGGGDKLSWQKEHLMALADFCEALPRYYETERFVFVHAGAYRNIKLADQSDGTLLWRTGEHYGYDSGGKIKKLVVGHTIQDKIINNEFAVCVDLGAYITGTLAAVDLINDRQYIARIPKKKKAGKLP